MSGSVNIQRLAAAALASAATLAASASAMWAQPKDVPVERIIQNVQERLTRDPNDQGALLTLARAHSMAFYLEKDAIPVYTLRDDLLEPIGFNRVGEGPGEPGVPPRTTARAIEHLQAAIVAFNRLLELQPRKVEAYLGLAYVLEMGREMASDVDATPRLLNEKHFSAKTIAGYEQSIEQLLPSELRREQWSRVIRGDYSWGNPQPTRDLYVRALWNQRNTEDVALRKVVRRLLEENWETQTKECYFFAFCEALPDDSRRAEQQMAAAGLMQACEAATGYIRVAAADGEQPIEQVRLKVARAALKAFSELEPSNATTPIVMHLSECQSLSRLTDASVTTAFDLDGSGRDVRWPWLKPDTALLVWNPTGDGRITSGRQLFGSVSWWLMFGNGYDALDALDDNRNGELSGSELAGLGVWQDRNQDGVSDPGEVRTLAQAGVVAIAARPDCQEDGCPAATKGVRLSDGRELPTYDWFVSPVITR
jgi:tetratricopeptide (TPR) repeat protein